MEVLNRDELLIQTLANLKSFAKELKVKNYGSYRKGTKSDLVDEIIKARVSKRTSTPGESPRAPKKTSTPRESSKAPKRTSTPGESSRAPKRTSTPGESSRAPKKTSSSKRTPIKVFKTSKISREPLRAINTPKVPYTILELPSSDGDQMRFREDMDDMLSDFKVTRMATEETKIDLDKIVSRVKIPKTNCPCGEDFFYRI